MEYIFDLDRQYTSSLGENLKKLEYIEYTHCMHINSIIRSWNEVDALVVSVQ